MNALIKHAPLVSIVTVVRNRPNPLQQTIESVRRQTYGHIEHIIIDGASDDDTIDVIRAHQSHVAQWTSEPDEGIYDAINKGIARATGDYVMLLHAGDIFEPDYIERLVAAADGDVGGVYYCDHSRGLETVFSSDFSDGIYLHHLGICHCAFLVPKAVYYAVGPYDPTLRVFSDMIWIHRARDQGIAFHRLPGTGLFFAEGGLSSAANDQAREMIIAEGVLAARLTFPFLPEHIARNIYLYRFDENLLGEIASYIAALQSDCVQSSAPLQRQFLSALRHMMLHLWKQRRIAATSGQALVRWRVALQLDIDPGAINAGNETWDVAAFLARTAEIRRLAAGRALTVHYAQVFSRTTETFIYDFYQRIEDGRDSLHVLICDQRINAATRPIDNLIALPPSYVSTELYTLLMEHFLEGFAEKSFIFHFATNGWRFLSRLPRRYQQLPAIYMTHGVDVFDLFSDSPCTDFILKVAGKLPNVRFTAVSDYLRSNLVEAGIPADKIALVHNVVHPRFFEHRMAGQAKRAAREDSGYAARIINMGRLIALKGHADLVRAVGQLHREGIRLHLTIVTGGIEGNSEEQQIRALIEAEGLADDVRFISSVSFADTPRFFDDYDVLVSASTYTDGEYPRSESFGMTILEGMAAGLPVVATDAGGQPEVAGAPGEFVRIARHSDPVSLAEELRAIVAGGALDGDNLGVAKAQLEHFSAERQIAAIHALQHDIAAPRLRPVLFSTGLNHGAGGAAQGVHRALLAAGVDSRIHFRNLISDWQYVPAAEPVRNAPQSVVDAAHPSGEFIQKNHTIFSIDTDGVPQQALEQIVADADVVNLHWYARFLSHENIAWLSNCGKPLILTIRDMNPLTGGCHFFHGCDGWKSGCHTCPQFIPADLKVAQENFAFKQRFWNFDNISIVVLSEHTRNIVSQSPLLGQCRIKVIPNAIDTDVFQPIDKAQARESLAIPEGRKVIGYIPSYQSSVKGAAEFARMLSRLERDYAPDSVIVVCAGGQKAGFDTGFETILLGQLNNKDKLAAFYSAADVVVIPSLEETFSNTALEAIACGTPIAGFATGAIPTFAQGNRGATVALGDHVALAKAVGRILETSALLDPQELHAYAVEHHTPAKIGATYAAFYRETMDASQPARRQDTVPPKLAPTAAYLALRHGRLAQNPARSGNNDKTAAGQLTRSAQSALNVSKPVELVGDMRLNPGVTRDHFARIHVPPSLQGHAIYGPHMTLDEGHYRLSYRLNLSPVSNLRLKARRGWLVAECCTGADKIVVQHMIRQPVLASNAVEGTMEFTLDRKQEWPQEGFEFRITSSGGLSLEIVAVTLLRVSATAPGASAAAF